MQGHASLLDPVAEPRQHRGEDRQRGEHGDRDHEDRAPRERDERLVAADEHAGHRDDHGHPGDQHGPPRGGGGRLERRSLAPPGGTLLALTAEVEERVVHAHGQPDQQDDGGEVAVGRDELARDRHHAQGGHHGREADQQRQARRHQCPERDDEDDQRDRDGQHPGLREVVLDDPVDGLVGAGAAELLDRQIRVIGLNRRDRGEGGSNSVASSRSNRRRSRSSPLPRGRRPRPRRRR